MRTKIRFSVFCLALTIFAVGGHAAEVVFPTAQEMAGWCAPYKTATEYGGTISVIGTTDSQSCYGAFLAARQFATTDLSGRRVSILKVCAPDNSSLLEWIKVFIHFIDEHPQRGHEKFTDVLLSSLWTAWPCAISPKQK